ncbi:hypothetical protein NUU61_002481 [Penicillium alfredii]|uniref:Uncharacterized protein n=1 Tax=Penicillium alfredii TaxID=1506179 RepID=A0A9W9KG08_9EURO|nr:uncharacterized protein NUU61_002481 [Penicillium alfredii]KAJ5105134.1 hypothetical protein NUU61_002481 [Penicillium alfredii]
MTEEAEKAIDQAIDLVVRLLAAMMAITGVRRRETVPPDLEPIPGFHHPTEDMEDREVARHRLTGDALERPRFKVEALAQVSTGEKEPPAKVLA